MNLLKIDPITIINCDKYRKLGVKNPKILQIFKCGSNNRTIFKKEESIEILKVFDLIGNINR